MERIRRKLFPPRLFQKRFLGANKHLHRKFPQKRFLGSTKGQALIEYLILVALMAVAAIGILRTLNQTVNAKFATITYSLQGSKKRKAPVDQVGKEQFSKRDLSTFMNGASRHKGK